MDLHDINKKLEEIATEYPTKVKALRAAESAYNLRFWDLMLHSGMGTIAAKEAEANLTCQEEGLLEPLQILRADVRALWHEKDCYIEIARNLRTLSGGQKEQSEQAW